LGSPVKLATADSEGKAVFTGLADNTRFFFGAEVEGAWNYEPFWTYTPSRMNPNEMLALEATGEHLEAHEVLTKAHGIDSTKVLSKPESPATYTQTFSGTTHTHAEAELPTNVSALALLTEVITNVNKTNKAVNELKKLTNALIDEHRGAGIAK